MKYIVKENIQLDLILGEEYEIVHGRKTGKKYKTLYFRGVLIQETKDFYVLRCKHGYCESFLKIDFAIQEYKIRNATTKKYVPVYF